MSILKKNLKRLREENNLKISYVAGMFNISPSAVSQWEYLEKGTKPSVETLIVLANLYKTTVEEITTNPKCKSGEILSDKLDLAKLTNIFKLLEKNKSINYAVERAVPSKKAYIFGILFALIEQLDDVDINEVAIDIIGERMNKNEQKNKNKKTVQRAGRSSSGRKNKSKATH